MRAMDFGKLADLEAKYGPGHNIFPLPETNLTHPASIVKPHREAKRALLASARVANREEVRAGREMAERPLIVFTLLAQMAVGAFWVLRVFGDAASGAGTLLALCGVMAIALITSFLHLGTWRNAWLAIRNLQSSWLSREILFSLLFMGPLFLYAVMPWLGSPHTTTREVIGWGTALSGMGLVYSMTRVYRLRTVPTWDTSATTISFFATTLLLGVLGCAALMVYSPRLEQLLTEIQWLDIMAIVLLTMQILLPVGWNSTVGANPTLFRLRIALLAMSLISVAFSLWDGSRLGIGTATAFVLAFAAEVTGRCSFYQSRHKLRDGI
jgi:anaerobic dimethyl sulfoxide reductase subunit C (anchor subunit)